MASRFRQYPRLLSAFAAVFFLAAFAPLAFAEPGPGEALRVLLVRAPDAPALGGTLTITILVDHPRPAEVVVRPPAFPSGFVLERRRLEGRLLPGSSDKAERWTAAEYTFKLTDAGVQNVGAFSVAVRGKSARTEPFAVEVSGGAPLAPRRTLRWEGLPDELRAGVPVEFRLIGEGFSPEPSLVPVVAVPERAILEALGASDEERSAFVVFRYRLTALEAGSILLPTAVLRFTDGATVSAPALRIPAVSSAAESSPIGVKPGIGPRTVESKSAKPAFPAVSAVPAPFRAASDRVFAAARSSWDAGDYQAAVAALRTAERDAFCGLFIRPTRAEAERSLLAASSRDEPYAPFVPLLAVVLAFAAAAIAAAAVLARDLISRRSVTSDRRRRFIIVFAAASVSLLAFGRLAYAARSARESVVLDSCAALRVPDPSSARSAEFAAGQAARVTAQAGEGEGSWLFVELDDGRSGWIEAAKARRY